MLLASLRNLWFQVGEATLTPISHLHSLGPEHAHGALETRAFPDLCQVALQTPGHR